MFLEDLGLGKNAAGAHIAANHAKQKDVDWLQVQGNGISDEYIAETNEARGDLHFAWQALSRAMSPLRSPAEIDGPLGGDVVYKGMTLQKHGKALCQGLKF